MNCRSTASTECWLENKLFFFSPGVEVAPTLLGDAAPFPGLDVRPCIQADHSTVMLYKQGRHWRQKIFFSKGKMMIKKENHLNIKVTHGETWKNI